MNRDGFAPIVAILIMVALLAIGVDGYLFFRNNTEPRIPINPPVSTSTSVPSTKTNQSSTPGAVISSTTLQISSSVVETAPTLSLDAIMGTFDGYPLTYGMNTIEGVTFNVLPLYSIGQTYNDRCRGDCSQDPFQIWSRYGDYKFIANYPAGWSGNKLGIYFGPDIALDQIGAIDIGSADYGYPSLQTFSYKGRDYFVVGSTMNAGTGGADDLHALFSDVAGSSTQSFNLWDNGWGWGGGYAGSTEPPWGDEYGGRLDFVVVYNGHIFLFPKSEPVVEIDENGTMIANIDQTSSTAVNILMFSKSL